MVQMVKQKIVEELRERISSNKNVLVMECVGLNANDNVQLRKTLRRDGVTMQVIQNRLTRIALAGSDIAEITELLVGSSTLVYGLDDPAVLAKLASEATRELDGVKIRGGFIEGRLCDAKQIRALALLPGREQLLGQVAGTIAAPMTGLGRAMNQIILKIGYALNARIDKLRSA